MHKVVKNIHKLINNLVVEYGTTNLEIGLDDVSYAALCDDLNLKAGPSVAFEFSGCKVIIRTHAMRKKAPWPLGGWKK